MVRRVAMGCLLVLVVAACGDDDAVTTTAADTTTTVVETTTTTGGETTPSAPIAGFVDTFDGTTLIAGSAPGQYTAFEFLEGGVMRYSRVGEAGFGVRLYGDYSGVYGDGITVTMRFKHVGPGGDGSGSGIFILGDGGEHDLAVHLLRNGMIDVIPVLLDYPADYTSLDGRANFIAGDFNELAVTVDGSVVYVSLNGTMLGAIGQVPVSPGILGIVINAVEVGDGIEIDEFSVQPAA